MRLKVIKPHLAANDEAEKLKATSGSRRLRLKVLTPRLAADDETEGLKTTSGSKL